MGLQEIKNIFLDELGPVEGIQAGIFPGPVYGVLGRIDGHNLRGFPGGVGGEKTLSGAGDHAGGPSRFRKFRGSTEREFLAWLRQILIHCLHHAIETHVKAQRRDVRCEVSIDQVGFALDRSAANFANALADPGPSPSTLARQRERAVALADQLAKLRPEYRDVIVLRNLQGLSFEEIAERMDRKTGAVRMLWLRAIEKFKQVYEPIDG